MCLQVGIGWISTGHLGVNSVYHLDKLGYFESWNWLVQIGETWSQFAKHCEGIGW